MVLTNERSASRSVKVLSLSRSLRTTAGERGRLTLPSPRHGCGCLPALTSVDSDVVERSGLNICPPLWDYIPLFILHELQEYCYRAGT